MFMLLYLVAAFATLASTKSTKSSTMIKLVHKMCKTVSTFMQLTRKLLTHGCLIRHYTQLFRVSWNSWNSWNLADSESCNSCHEGALV